MSVTENGIGQHRSAHLIEASFSLAWQRIGTSRKFFDLQVGHTLKNGVIVEEILHGRLD